MTRARTARRTTAAELAKAEAGVAMSAREVFAVRTEQRRRAADAAKVTTARERGSKKGGA